MALYKFGPLVSPQLPSLNYVANIAVEYSFIYLTDSEMHQVLLEELLTQTPSKGCYQNNDILCLSCVESVTMFKL